MTHQDDSHLIPTVKEEEAAEMAYVQEDQTWEEFLQEQNDIEWDRTIAAIEAESAYEQSLVAGPESVVLYDI